MAKYRQSEVTSLVISRPNSNRHSGSRVLQGWTETWHRWVLECWSLTGDVGRAYPYNTYSHLGRLPSAGLEGVRGVSGWLPVHERLRWLRLHALRAPPGLVASQRAAAQPTNTTYKTSYIPSEFRPSHDSRLSISRSLLLLLQTDADDTSLIDYQLCRPAVTLNLDRPYRNNRAAV